MTTKISELGGVIQGNWDDEEIITCIADGNAKAGMVAGITSSGIVDLCTTTSHDLFVGICLPHHKVDIDTVITDTFIMSIVVPQDGHIYGMLCDDVTASLPGNAVGFGANAGLVAPVGNIEDLHVARTYKYISADTAGLFVWGP